MAVKVIANTIHSAKVLLYQKKRNTYYFLITKESDTNLYGFPGGAQEETDRTIRETIERETREEIGLSPASYTLVEIPYTHEFVHEDTSSPRFGKKGILHIFVADYLGHEPIHPSEEIAAYYWLSKDDIIKKLQSSYAYWPEIFTKALRHLSV